MQPKSSIDVFLFVLFWDVYVPCCSRFLQAVACIFPMCSKFVLFYLSHCKWHNGGRLKWLLTLELNLVCKNPKTSKQWPTNQKVTFRAALC